jgi:signal recognition particle subunit SRP54
MLDSLSNKITGIFEKLRKSGILKESDVDDALREIRVALLEADVSLEVAKKFIQDVKEKAIGQNIVKSISPGQMFIKIVHDYLVELLGKTSELAINKKPYKIILVGLQGAGKTTTAGKLAKFFTKKNKKVMLASTDTDRPAAIQQLRVLSQKVNGASFAQSSDDSNLTYQQISELAMKKMNDENSDVLILDTAGRSHINDVKMGELVDTQKIVNADEIFLVVDIMTGQDSINIAKKFSESLEISGIILTRTEGEARGGVALSMKALTGCDIKFLGVGEQLDDLEFFDPTRIAGRLLGMGDIVSIVEKAQEAFSEKEAEETMKKMKLGIFSLDDFASQMEKMSKLGGLKFILNMLPQSNQLKTMMNSHNVSDRDIIRNIAIIRSMTKKEKKNYKLINGSRRKRIAAGSGTAIQDVNKLIRHYEYSLDIMKRIGKWSMLNG